MPLIDPFLLAIARLSTFEGTRGLTNASGFFFRRDDRVFLVTSRHVFFDEPTGHHPDRLEIELHLDADNAVHTTCWSVLLYENGSASWRQGRDSAGDIDVAVIEIAAQELPPGATLLAFEPHHLLLDAGDVRIGQALVIPGYPLGFHDDVNRLPVSRGATLASPWGLRFQGLGCFLTDARTHRGTSGAPVLMHRPLPGDPAQALHWQLLGVHSSRLDMGNRDLEVDESLGLNMSWYADILMTLTEPPDAPARSAAGT